MSKRTVSDEQLVVSYKELLSANKVAALHGVNWKTVYRALKKAGVEATGLAHYREQAQRYPQAVQKEIADLYASGVKTPALVSRFGGSTSSIIQAIERQGGQMEPLPGKPTKITDEQCVDLCEKYQAGMPQVALAKLFHVDARTVKRILQLNNIFIRSEKKTRIKGRWIDRWGYVRVRVSAHDQMSCMADQKNGVAEHRLMIARMLGRPLFDYETVHHINGDRQDNRIENLQLRTGRHGKHVALRCRACGSVDIEYTRIADA